MAGARISTLILNHSAGSLMSPEREYAYDQDTHFGRLDKATRDATAHRRTQHGG